MEKGRIWIVVYPVFSSSQLRHDTGCVVPQRLVAPRNTRHGPPQVTSAPYRALSNPKALRKGDE